MTRTKIVVSLFGLACAYCYGCGDDSDSSPDGGRNEDSGGVDSRTPMDTGEQQPDTSVEPDADSDAGETSRYEIAAYYFPNYHVDPTNEKTFGKGWTEWELVKSARPRFKGNRQPRVPEWGYEDESDPEVMAHKIDVAADHGITQFIFDWYWYEGEPFLERALEEGFLEASNRDRLNFSIMWANHDWRNYFPAPPGGTAAPLLYPGAVDPDEFDRVMDYLIEHYFTQPNYWKIDGRPYLSIYDVPTLISGLGGVLPTRLAFERLREKAKKAGFPDVHLNMILADHITISPSAVEGLGFDSVTHYTWVHHVPLSQFPESSYAAMVDHAHTDWAGFDAAYNIPYFPHVTVGWDVTPRTDPDSAFTNSGYPYMPVAEGNTPEEVERAFEYAKAFLMNRENYRVLTVNSWNEWTEGSYLEPDTENGTAYLDAMERVFLR